MSDVLLVQPPMPEHLRQYAPEVVVCPPLGLGYLASTLLENGFKVELTDLSVENPDRKGIELEFQTREPKILGITTTTNTYKNALNVAAIAKECNPNVLTILGGPHVTFTEEETLRNQQVDIVVRHEGELTMLELCQRLLRGDQGPKQVAGVSYRKDSAILKNPDRPLIENLDEIPFPARHLMRLDKYLSPGTIITSRGCPSKCIFCAAEAMSGGKYRVRSPANVVAEIEKVADDFSPKFFFIADDTFTVFRDRTREICKLLSNLAKKVEWVCESRANFIDKPILQEMAEAGCTAIQFGVESGSEKILNAIKKGINLDQVRRAVRWAVEAKILPVCSFMVPHPEDTWKTVKETKRFMLELKDMGAFIYVSMTTPFPGTNLYTHAKELGVTIITEDTDKYDLTGESPVIRTRNLSVEAIKAAYNDLVSICPEEPPYLKR